MSSNPATIDTDVVQSRMIDIRGERALLDRDIATLYGVETREINQAVRNNPDKFPSGYVFQMTDGEFGDWKSKILISNLSEEEKAGIRKGLRHAPNVFTERGLYMLATILKGRRAVQTTLAIIETFAKVRALKRELVELHKETRRAKQPALLRHFGETLADIVMPDADSVETESSLELNFIIGKIKHTVKKTRKNPAAR